MTDTKAREYVDSVVDDCRTAIEQSGFMSHYSERFRKMTALNMKNKYLRWWHEFSRGK